MLSYIVSAVFFMQKSKLKVWELALLLALCLSLCEATVEAGRQSALSEKIVRLHVIAASDSAEAQAKKLEVRDAVLPLLSGLMSEAGSAAEASALIESRRAEIISAAQKAAGEQSVELRFGRESYGSRQTERYALPAGEYNSLRIILGEGEGRNWWGVIFPQLDAAAGYAEAAKILGEDELALIYEEEGVELRFKFLEVLEWLRAMLEN